MPRALDAQRACAQSDVLPVLASQDQQRTLPAVISEPALLAANAGIQHIDSQLQRAPALRSGALMRIERIDCNTALDDSEHYALCAREVEE